MQRFWEIDFLRGIAIVMMVVFHFLWDLNYFGYIQVDLYKGFFGLFQIATAGLFLLLVGVMLAVGAERHNKNYSLHFVKRGIKIFCAGLLVTIVTFIFFPQNFVYFGILHLIGVSIIISIP
ncbi:MAG: heparan-alpha-glucosaminide N-acetyltransferase, partial [archaeon]